MARHKAAAAGASEPTPLDLKNLTLFLDGGGRRGEVSRSECMKQTEAELQRLFHSRLVEIMDSNGYHDGDFTETDVAKVMVANGLMDAPSGDPLVALATELKSEMCSIFHSNMRRMSNNVIDPEFLAGIASDPIVIDSIIDLSRGRVCSSDSCDAPAPFEDIAKALRNFTLTEYASRSVAAAAANEGEDTDSNDEHEDKAALGNVPEVPSAVDTNTNLPEDASIGDDDTTAPADHLVRARQRDQGKSKARRMTKEEVELARTARSAPASASESKLAPVSAAPATVPETEPEEKAAPKAAKNRRRRARKSMHKDATATNGDLVSKDVVPPVASVDSTTAPPDNAPPGAETPAEKLVQVGHVYGRTPEGMLTRFPMMGPPPPPTSSSHKLLPGIKLSKVASVTPVTEV
ncbi:hypothetical protein GGI21_005926, partial [Coemansia aciculifera]